MVALRIFIAAVVLFVGGSAGMAVATADECNRYGGAKTWVVLPPHWECDVADGTP